LLLLQARKYLIEQSTDSNNTKGNDGKTEKPGKPVSPQQKISTKNQREMKKTDT
jgi:hypothetical protein